MKRTHPLPLDPTDGDLDAADIEPCGEATEPLEVGARVEERCEEHVAGDPADAIQVYVSRHGWGTAARAMRAAIVPAPKPSSMPTTASPAAQEHSIAFSAVLPPSAEP